MLTCIGLVFVLWCDEPAARLPAARCPPLVDYDRTTQDAAARQLRGLPAGSPVRRLVTDYGDLRRRCRAYEGR